MRSLVVYPSLFLALFSGEATAQNIVNNGGFEYGLMCYVNYVWSDSGVVGAGDYQFHLSTDSHSGTYSLEIACEGTDCPKAAAFSNRIPTPPNQQYVLNVYAKCPAGATGAVYIPGMANGDVFQYTNCTGDWALNMVPFQTPPTGTNIVYYLFSYSGNWVRFDDVVLTYGDGTVPSSTILHAGKRNVSTTSNAVVVDGSPYLAYGFFDVDYPSLPQVAAMGANTVFSLGLNSSPAGCFNTAQENYGDKAYDLGLAYVPDSSTTARLGTPSVFGPVMSQFGPHLANIAWMIADEPDQSVVPFWYMNPSTFISDYTAMKAQSTLPLFADFQRAAWSVPTDVSPYVTGVDFFMAEPYGSNFQTLNYATNMFQSFPPARPVWLAQDDPAANLIVPKAYWALVNGVTGLGYFSWPVFQTESDKLAAVQQVFSELGQLKKIVFGQNLGSLVTGTAGIGYIVRSSGNATYIIAANPGTASVTAAFQVAGLAQGQSIQVMFENRSITATAGGFSDSFAGPDRHVYVINTGGSGLLPPAGLSLKVL